MQGNSNLNQGLNIETPEPRENESSGAVIIEFNPWNREATAALQQELARLLSTCERMADYLGYDDAVCRLSQTRGMIGARRRAS